MYVQKLLKANNYLLCRVCIKVYEDNEIPQKRQKIWALSVKKNLFLA